MEGDELGDTQTGSAPTPTPTETSMANSVPSQNSMRSIRSKTDVAWAYVSEIKDAEGKRTLICSFCGKNQKGGGIHRMKMHLAGQRGDVGPCKKVPIDVRTKMKENLDELKDHQKEIESLENARNPFGPSVHEFDGDDCGGEGNSSKTSTKKRKLPAYLGSGKQPSIKAALQTKERALQVDMVVANFFYDCCIPMNSANSIYYKQMADAIASYGYGYKMPSYHALRTNLLEIAKKDVRLLVDSYRSQWVECGCTIMGDGWKDSRQRSLINFLVYCPKGICFIKSVDASDIISSAENLCRLFSEIVDIVGATNVVHIVTDNAANYKAAGRLINEKYPNIFWTPCAAHCLNLMLKDIAKMPHIESLATRASSITVFVYNHKWTLSYLRRRDGWTEILRPGETRFATTFIALKSLYEHKSDLQAMVTDKEFLSWSGSKTKKAKSAINIIMDNQFWNDCLVIIKIVSPLVKLLRIVDSDESPALGYVYDGMTRAIRAIKETFKYVKRLYEPYTQILEERWDRQLRQDVHCAAYWFNPIFHFGNNFDTSSRVMDGLLTILQNKDFSKYSHQKLLDEASILKSRENIYGEKKTIEASQTMKPGKLNVYNLLVLAILKVYTFIIYMFISNLMLTLFIVLWWQFHGHKLPRLQKLALRLLSQNASSSGCERNWSVFERIHSKKRNRLEHERLNDLVYVHYNLRLKNRILNKKENVDPIDYACIDEIDSWIFVDELAPEPELNIEELENMATNQEMQQN